MKILAIIHTFFRSRQAHAYPLISISKDMHIEKSFGTKFGIKAP